MHLQRVAFINSERNLIWGHFGLAAVSNDIVAWSFPKETYGQHVGLYFIVILSPLVGFFATIIQWLVSKVHKLIFFY